MRFSALLAFPAILLCALAGSRAAQAADLPLGIEVPVGGFEVKVPVAPTAAERAAQPNLWMMEVEFKPLRMLWIDITDPKTGKKSRELIWYLVYRTRNRLFDHEQRADVEPVNTLDDPPGPPLLVPEFTLVGEFLGKQTVYDDVILPEAQAAIMARERMRLKNPVEIVQPVPPPVPPDADDDEREAGTLYGVAMWRGIDPDTDFATVIMSGFSNSYKLAKNADDEPIAYRKAIVQRFWRPGDRFGQHEKEIRLQGEPQWIDRIDDAPLGLDVAVPDPPAEDADDDDAE